MEDKEPSQEVKNMYNDYLYASRTFNREPFRAKKDFKGFVDNPDYRHFYTLTRWFKKHDDVNKKLFFEATLFYHKNEKYVHIGEYTKSKAFTNYTNYCRVINALDLDNLKSLEFCKESYEFIRDFCKSKNIKVVDYLEYTEQGSQPAFFLHIKAHKVCRYSLFTYSSFIDKMKFLYRQQEVWTIYMGDNNFTPNFYLNRWNSSVRYKKLAGLMKQKLTK